MRPIQKGCRFANTVITGMPRRSTGTVCQVEALQAVAPGAVDPRVVQQEIDRPAGHLHRRAGGLGAGGADA